MATMTADFSGMKVRGSRNRAETIAERNRDLMELQRRARRGPTPEIFFTKHLDNSRIVKADDPVRKREMRMFSIAMTALFVLVMVYVWQHFSAVELGYQVETQRAEVQKLEEANRQLRLTEAQLTEPARIDKIAKQLGLDAPQPGQVIRTDGANDTRFGGPVMASVAAAPRAIE
jgi:cell division protein FtsL